MAATPFEGHSQYSVAKAIYDHPEDVAPADRLYATDTALDKSVGGGVTNKALTSNVATLTTASAHGIGTGVQIAVAGVDSTFNGTYTTVAGTSGSSVKYALTHADVTSAAASGTVKTTDGSGDAYDPASYSSQPGAAARAKGYPRA